MMMIKRFACYTLFALLTICLMGFAFADTTCTCENSVGVYPLCSCNAEQSECCMKEGIVGAAATSAEDSETYFVFSDTVSNTDEHRDEGDTSDTGGAAPEQWPWAELFGIQDLRPSYMQEVKYLQVYLNAYMKSTASAIDPPVYLRENGMYDIDTERAVRKFQMQNAIQASGYVGAVTKAKLFEVVGFIF